MLSKFLSWSHLPSYCQLTLSCQLKASLLKRWCQSAIKAWALVLEEFWPEKPDGFGICQELHSIWLFDKIRTGKIDTYKRKWYLNLLFNLLDFIFNITEGPRLVHILGLEKTVLHVSGTVLKYGSEEKGSSLYKCSILLGFILSKNLRGLWFYLLIKVQNATSLVFLTWKNPGG